MRKPSRARARTDTPRFPTGSALVLLGAFAALATWSIVTTSLTYDEPSYIEAGGHHLAGDFAANREHPPLAKELIALPPTLLQAAGLLAAPPSGLTVLPLFRLSSLMAGLATAALCGWWAWRLWRAPMAAIVSIGLASFDPNLVANASVATLDCFLTFFIALTLYLLWELRRHPWSMTRVAFAGLAIGCALGAKASAILLLPFAMFFFLRPAPSAAPSGWMFSIRDGAPRLALACVVAVVMLSASYGFGSVGRFVESLFWQTAHAHEGHDAFLLGEYSSKGWLLYYPATMLMKTPVATLIAIGVGAVAVIRSADRDAAVALLIFPGVFVLVSVFSFIDIGVRYVLPAYPPLLVAAGAVGAGQRGGRRFWPMLIVVATAASVLRIAPHTLSYFNEVVGGPEHAIALLSDSNIDWGQDLKGLAAYQKDHNLPAIYFAPFSTLQPALYGVVAEVLPSAPLGVPSGQPVVASDGPQLLAASVTTLQGTYVEGHDLYRWLFSREPIARIGYSILIYDITRDADAHERLAQVHARTGDPTSALRERDKAASIRAIR